MSEVEPAARVRRRWLLAYASAALTVVALLAIGVYEVARAPFGLDAAWMDSIRGLRGEPWTTIALAFDIFGGGVLPSTLVVLALLAWRRPWAGLYFGATALACVGVTQALKHVLGRPRPSDILVTSDFGSFPSGHSANAAVAATALAVIFARAWIYLVGALYTLAMMLSRTYLGAHWVSDTIAGALIGVAVALLVWTMLAPQLRRERARPHPPPWRRRSSTMKEMS